MLKSARKTEKDPEGRMPLAEHLRELRNRLLKAVLAISVITIVAMFFYKDIADFLMKPVLDSVGCPDGTRMSQLTEDGGKGAGKRCAEFTTNGLLSPFTIMLKVSFTTGVVLATPVWLYQLWAFLAPGLHRNEKKYGLFFVGLGVPLFVGGGFFAYNILPTTAEVLLEFTPEGVNNLLPLDDFLDLLTRMIVVFGLAFELPLLLLLLNFTGILSGRRMIGWWRGMIMGITVFGAIATPSTDPVGMFGLAVPVTVLYFGACGIALLNDRRKARRQAADPDFGLDDDEASHLDLTPEAVGASATPAELTGGDDESGPTRRNGYDDVT
ncbi:twin-arginine translocase subunit TatC [Streptomyces coffeae]|uniref:Sec-independent protein translocase protein TatC n=1 Tax=Streptomyces coffeae TaxID=621382 RepID=A0ABS1NPE4_9ACTN|nr:twin-arginine translocase subunit TatC [Streptomyces coffeae]MBL1101878.1 twin-arginine translocase subunit TatC [Streptomyces coffeae]